MNNMKVKIEADGTGFDKTINSAEKGLENFEKKADEAGKSLYDLRKAEQATKNEIQELNKKITEAKLAKLGQDASGAAGGFLKLSSSITSCIPGFDLFKGKAQLAVSALKDLPNVLKGIGSGAAGAASGLGMLSNPIGWIAVAGAAVVGLGVAAGKAGSEFDTHMSKLLAITGAVGKDLEFLRDKSKELAKVSGKAAGDIADSFTLIGSLMPALLKTSDALASVGESAMTLATAGGISAEAAASSIATIINQYLVGMDKLDPKEKSEEIATATKDIINVLALAQQAGSADINYLSNAMARSGVAATNSKIGYRELAAVIETLAPVSTSAETATTGLNTVLNKLEMQANNKIKPSIVGLQEALKNLAEMKLDTSGYKDMFGDIGAKTAQQLVNMREQLLEYNKTLNDTAQLESAAAKQAATMTDNVEGDINRLKGSAKNLLLQLYDSESFSAIGGVVRPILKNLRDMIDLVSELIVKFNNMQVVVAIFTAIGAAIRAVVTVTITLIKIVVETLNILFSIVETGAAFFVKLGKAAYNSVKDCLLFKAVKQVFDWVVDAVKHAYNAVADFFAGILDWYNDIRKSLGLNPIEIGFKKKEIEGGTGVNDSKIPDAALSNFGEGDEKGGTTTTTTTTGKTPEPEKESIGWYEKEISKINDKIKNTPSLVTEEDRKNLKDYEEKLDLLKSVNIEFGSIAYFEKEIAKINDKIKNTPSLVTDEDRARLEDYKTKLLELLTVKITNDSIDFYSKEIERINKLLQEQPSLVTDEDRARLEDYKKKLSELRKTQPENDSIAYYEKEISKINDLVKNAPSLVTEQDKKNLVDYTAKVEQLKKAISESNIKQAALNIKAPETGVKYSNNEIKDNTSKLKALLDIETDPLARTLIQRDIDQWDLLLKLLTDPTYLDQLKKSFEDASLAVDDSINESMRETYNGVKTLIGGAENLYNTWSNLNEVMNNDDSTAVEKVFAVADAITSTIDTFVGFFDLISKITEAFKAIGKAADVAKKAETGVANATKMSTAAKQQDVAMSQQLTAANITGTTAAEGRALAEGAASGASLAFPMNIVAIAAIIASIVGVISMISSLSAPSYATGGIAGGVIQGNGLSNGDRVHINVNRGEMILNSSQQAKLWRAIQNGNLGASSPVINGEVRFEIEGDSLIGILNNYNKIYERS